MNEKSFSVPADPKDWQFSVSKSFVCNKNLSVGARLLLVVLRSFAGFNENSCFPGRDHLCNILDTSKDTLLKWMTELETGGYLQIEQRKTKGRFASNVYKTAFSPCPKFSDTVFSCPVPPDTTDQTLRCTISKDSPSREELPKVEVMDALASPRKKTSLPKPSLEDVKTYAGEIGMSSMQAESFYDHFESNGWLVGGKTKMQDWKAAVRNWKRNDERFTAGRNNRPAAGQKVRPSAENNWTGTSW